MPVSQDVDDFRSLIAHEESSGLGNLQEAIAAYTRLREEAARRDISKWIVLFYIGVVGSITLYLIYLGAFRGKEVVDALFDIIKIALIPIVTFVLGYYYGTSKSRI